MKKIVAIIVLLTIVSCNETTKKKKESVKDKSELKIYNVSQAQLKFANQYKNDSEAIRNKIFIDSIFKPYQYFIEGYMGKEKDFTDWMNNQIIPNLDHYNKLAEKVNLSRIKSSFDEKANEIAAFTGLIPKGDWFFIYGPSWVDMGGFSDNKTMLVDLAHEQMNDLNTITSTFPHEFNHQIYGNTLNFDKKTPIINRIIDEGFAVYVSHKIHAGKKSIAEELNYTEEEYKVCEQNKDELISFIKDIYLKNDENLAEDFADRGVKLNEKFPGAIGYFIGLKIVEEYVKLNGPDSWKDIYFLKPAEVLEKSKVFEKIKLNQNKVLKGTILEKLAEEEFVIKNKDSLEFNLPFNLHSLDCGAPDCYTSTVFFKIKISDSLVFPKEFPFSFQESGCHVKDSTQIKSVFRKVEETNDFVNYYSKKRKSNLIIGRAGELYYILSSDSNNVKIQNLEKQFDHAEQENSKTEIYKNFIMNRNFLMSNAEN
ncbi:DUF2268 domain-containing putative Zn-dependent protease [Aureivirga sp. CE67]|uniref:gliding motility protein GldB-related protein n=1 Tax=Aureivirga sp. CE67 TaxID=1788983 RepID=UPI0018C9C396|nr:DUF2268 domain-containing putative Zn-dependent protease [Aureivirga sp. CE67]